VWHHGGGLSAIAPLKTKNSFPIIAWSVYLWNIFQVNIILTLAPYIALSHIILYHSVIVAHLKHSHTSQLIHSFSRNAPQYRRVCASRSVRGKLQHHNIRGPLSVTACNDKSASREVCLSPPPKSKRALLLFFQGGSALDKILAPCTPTTLLIYSTRAEWRQTDEKVIFVYERSSE
jgi:hypothetical protein